MQNSVSLDTPLLQDYMDNLGQPIVQQMLDLYTQQSEVYLADIANALADGTQENWQECCHKMKGAAGSVGLQDVHAKLAAIEKSQEMDALKQVYLRELKDLNQNSISAFKKWLG